MDDFIAPKCHEDIKIVHEDDFLLIINKPSGLLSLSGKNPLNKDSVHHRLVQNYTQATMVHRLDFGTSGLMVVALNKTVNANLTKQFQARSIVKQYQATLLGHLEKSEGRINAPLAKHTFPLQKVCFSTGKAAETDYKVVKKTFDEYSGLALSEVVFTPKTGRTHQLRVHSQYIRHPIIGCDLYGLSINGVNSQRLSSRLMLHACSLEFNHPFTDERCHFKSDFKQG